jgi:hypothetical protein
LANAADEATVVVTMVVVVVVVSASRSKTLEPVIAPTAVTLTKLVLKGSLMEPVTPIKKLVLATK